MEEPNPQIASSFDIPPPALALLLFLHVVHQRMDGLCACMHANAHERVCVCVRVYILVQTCRFCVYVGMYVCVYI